MNNRIKNLVVIFLVLIVFLFAGAIYFSYDNDNKINKEINTEEQLINKDELEKSFLEIIKPKEKAQDIPEIKKNIEITTEKCNSIIDDEVKNKCLDYIILDSVIEKHDLLKCDELESDFRDVCIYKIIESEKTNLDSCSGIINTDIKNLCFKNAAIFSRNLDYCEQVSNLNEKIDCRDRILSSRVNPSDITKCADIKTPLYFAICVNNSKQECSEFNNEETINNCRSWRYFDEVIKNNDKKYCEILASENFKKVCQIYFAEGNYLDSDSDGVNDREELNYGSNPFVFDEEIKLQADNRKNNANLVYDVLFSAREIINQALK